MNIGDNGILIVNDSIGHDDLRLLGAAGFWGHGQGRHRH